MRHRTIITRGYGRTARIVTRGYTSGLWHEVLSFVSRICQALSAESRPALSVTDVSTVGLDVEAESRLE